MKPALISGIQPSGKLHIGNYLGALKNFVELQNSGKYACYFFIADLHSLTENFDPKDKQRQILELAADYLAAGLDPKKSTLFLQSEVPAHAELAWILNTITPMGELRRMTQFKDKSKTTLTEEQLRKMYAATSNIMGFAYLIQSEFNESSDAANAGLFDYPVLMAADILLYDARFVPVGNDQDQHLELTRTLARKFNAKFGATFIEPKGLHTNTPRVMSLKDPTKKMSKSQPEGCLFLDDGTEEVKAKIGRAVTDSGSEIKYDPEHKAGISNLLTITAALRGEDVKKAEREFTGKSYAEFKKAVSGLIAAYFENFRAEKAKLLKKKPALIKTLAAGSAKAAEVAGKKIEKAREKIGIAI